MALYSMFFSAISMPKPPSCSGPGGASEPPSTPDPTRAAPHPAAPQPGRGGTGRSA